MKPQEKDSYADDAFRSGELQVLVYVATTVIEVGVDVPNATLMIIEHAGSALDCRESCTNYEVAGPWCSQELLHSDAGSCYIR